MPDGFVSLTVTSPPYGDLRKYNGYDFDYEAVADGLFRVTKDGGVVVWVVGDRTIDGDETGASFRQALYFKSIGFKLWDTMIWEKANPTPMDSRIPRYTQAFEYMFVFSKGVPSVCNHIRVACKTAGTYAHNNYPARRENGNKSSIRVISKTVAVRDTKPLTNIWTISASGPGSDHPAVFPEALARDHIISWSSEGDIVYDPFMGSGTTGKMAVLLNRQWIGSEISQEYVTLAEKRLEPYLAQAQLF